MIHIVGYNTPSIIKFNFWQQVFQNPLAVYASINNEAEDVPSEISNRAICIKGDAAVILSDLSEEMRKNI